ncbi:acyltransferase family protein [Nostoc sp. KVJ3]|uniref:acyltransferase family protein n=1 Tax=Nostoc sp. KVJ3 TaxID=457945 RepID=UPI0022370092|nr:acyltransferase [Nostoc sp. KVJ3]MCW5313374.1 acyltransferase family protein [Nostoc sp. KVJ3]
MEKSLTSSPGANPKASSGVNAHSKMYIPSLDGIRTIAFLIVFLSHAGLAKVFPGSFGVTIFFFLSGYLITTLLRLEYDRYENIDLKFFYLRRILRIWPSFYLVLGLGAGLTLLELLPGKIIPAAFIAQFLHYTNYYGIFFGGGMAAGSWVYWSLAVEEHFYLLFPLFYLLLRKLRITPRMQMLIFWGLCLAVLLWRCVLFYGFSVSEGRILCSTDTRVDSILFGCALAVSGNPILDTQDYSNKLWKYFFLPLGIIVILLTCLSRSFEFRQTIRFTIQGIALYPIFITAIRFPNWGFFTVLNLKWVRFVGILSYSLYLVHYSVLFLIWKYFPQLDKVFQAGIGLLISFTLAYLIYQFIEFPFGRLRKKFSRA